MTIQNIVSNGFHAIHAQSMEDSFVIRVEDRVSGRTILSGFGKAEAEKLSKMLEAWIATQP